MVLGVRLMLMLWRLELWRLLVVILWRRLRLLRGSLRRVVRVLTFCRFLLIVRCIRRVVIRCVELDLFRWVGDCVPHETLHMITGVTVYVDGIVVDIGDFMVRSWRWGLLEVICTLSLKFLSFAFAVACGCCVFRSVEVNWEESWCSDVCSVVCGVSCVMVKTHCGRAWCPSVYDCNFCIDLGTVTDCPSVDSWGCVRLIVS